MPNTGNVPAFASLVLGAAGILLCFFVAVFRPNSAVVVLAIPVAGVLAVVFGGVGLSRSKARDGAGRDLAMGGCLLGVVTVVVALPLFWVDAVSNWQAVAYDRDESSLSVALVRVLSDQPPRGRR